MLTKGAIGNLVNRYRAVLKKCRLINVFGSLAVAGMLSAGLADAAFAQGSLVNGEHSFSDDTAVDADYLESGVRTGIIAKSGDMTVTVADEKTLTVSSTAQASDSRTYGATAQSGTSLDLSGGAVFTLKSESAGQQARIFCADGGNMDLSGTISASATSEDGIVVGAEAWNGATLSFSGEELNIDLQSESGRIMGVQNHNSAGAVCNFNSQKTVISILVSSDTGSAPEGIYAYRSTTNFTGNTEIIVRGGYLTSGMYVQCDPGDTYDTVINFSGDNTLIDVSGPGETYAVTASGVPGSINFTGKTAEIRATSSDDTAFGVVGQYGSQLTATADVAVTVQASEWAFGVQLTEYGGTGDYYAGNADFEGNLSVSATSENAEAYGVYNSTVYAAAAHTDDGKFNVSGDSTISAVAESGNAYGVYTAGEHAENTFEGNTEILASAPAGASFGILAEDASSISLGSEGTSTSITATGDDSTAVALDDTSSLSTAGTTTLEADTAMDGGGAITNSGDLTVVRGTVDSFTGTYTQNSGSTALADDSNFFGGDVTIKKGSLTVGDVDTSAADGSDSVLGLGRSIEVQPGQNLLIGTDSGTGVVFGAGSALVLDGNAASEEAMISGSDTLSVDPSSQLYITNAKANTSYAITEGLTSDSYWSEANLVANRLIKASILRDGDSVMVTTEVDDVASVLPGLVPVSAVTTMINSSLNNTDSDFMGIRFLSRATEPLYMSDNAMAVDTINEVSRAAVTAGVQNTSLRLADAAAGTVLKHLSLASFDAENSIHKDGTDVWATPMYGNTYTHDMSTSVCGNYGGLAIGADVHLGTFAGGNLRAGIAVNGGGGRSGTRDNATSTDNSYNFGGVSLYGGWTMDNLNIMASLGYNAGRHEIEMSLPSSLGMGTAEADVYTRAFTADLRAEYLFRTSFLDIMPHAGVRYTALYTDDYDLDVNGSRLNSVESDMQNIVQFPVGVTFSRDIEASGWIVRPQLDLSVVPAVGGLKAESEVCWSGINATDSVSTRIMDTVSYAGTLGIQAEYGNFAIGLNYGIQAAWHETNHSLNAGFTWKF